MLDIPTHHSDCGSFSFSFDHLGKDDNVNAPLDTMGSALNSSSRAFLKKNGDSSLGFLRNCQANRRLMCYLCYLLICQHIYLLKEKFKEKKIE